MRELAEASGVSAGTIKHYLREGLLPEPVRTSRNMAWYPPEFVERIRLIKQLQEERFMPLKAIKSVLDEDPERARVLVELEDRILERARRGRSPAGSRRAEVKRRYDMPAGGARPAGGDRAAHPDRPRVLGARRGGDRGDRRFRAGGYDEQIGFTVYDTLRYKRALEELVKEEVQVVLERMAGEMEPDRVVELMEAGAEPLRDFIAALHSKLLVEELKRQRDERNWLTTRRRAPPSRRSPRLDEGRRATRPRTCRTAGGSRSERTTRLVWSSRADHSVKRRPPTAERSGANSAGPTSRGRPSTQTVRSEHSGASWTPAPGSSPRAPILGAAHAGGPFPRGVAVVVARGLVHERRGRHRSDALARRAVRCGARHRRLLSPSRCSPRGRGGLHGARPGQFEIDLTPGARTRALEPASTLRRGRWSCVRAGPPSGRATAHHRCGIPPTRASPTHSITSAV